MSLAKTGKDEFCLRNKKFMLEWEPTQFIVY